MSWNLCDKRHSGPTCSRCGRQHPPPPPPGRTPTLLEEGGERWPDGSVRPAGSWAAHLEAERRAWCASWSGR